MMMKFVAVVRHDDGDDCMLPLMHVFYRSSSLWSGKSRRHQHFRHRLHMAIDLECTSRRAGLRIK